MLQPDGESGKEMLDPFALLDAAGEALAVADAAGSLQYMNLRFLLQFGFSDLSELRGADWHNLYIHADWIKREVEPALAQDQRWQGRIIAQKKDGRHFYQDLTIAAISDGRLVLVSRDITRQIETEAVANRRLAAIEVAGDGIGLVDPDGNLAYMNRALCALHGLDEEEVSHYLGYPWEMLYTDKGKKQIREVVLPGVYNYGYWRGESRLVRNDGKIVWAELSITLLDDGGFIGTARDITDRKNAEAENAMLREQFFQSQKMEAIGRLAGGIAHDFNNILASVSGFSEMLIEDLQPGSEQHLFATNIYSAAVQARDLVQQILTFSRRSPGITDRVEVREILGEVATMLRATFPTTIVLREDFDRSLPDLLANRTQIAQAVMNLGVNARDALPDHRGAMTLSAVCVTGREIPWPVEQLSTALSPPTVSPPLSISERGDGTCVLNLGHIVPDMQYVKITMADTGTGIDKTVLDRMFEPFFTTKGVEEGTGLGLATVLGILAGHEGAIGVSTRRDAGTSFSLYFPVKTLKRQSKSPKNTAPKPSRPLKHARRLVIVEDQDSVRALMVNMLQRYGYGVDAFADPFAAIDALREMAGKVDLVFTDQTMPGMTGEDLALQITEDFPDIPIVLTSGFSPKKLEEAMAENPSIKAVLHKPFTRGQLYGVLESVLGPRSTTPRERQTK